MTNAPKSITRDRLTTEREIELTEHQLNLITGGNGTNNAPHVPLTGGNGANNAPHVPLTGGNGTNNVPWKPTHH